MTAEPAAGKHNTARVGLGGSTWGRVRAQLNLWSSPSSGAASDHRSAYRPDIDGLRAIAVLAVVLYHAGLPLTSGGFVGVDVFFVISGYVIAKSLLGDLERGRFSISAFYERRVRRIFPALFVTFAVTWVAAFVLLLPSYFVDFSKSLAASAGFVSNLYFWKNSGYFANGANLRPLLHTWSLSVEEQYYIFAPIAFWMVYRFLGRRWLLTLLPVAAMSLALSVIATRVGPTANFFLLPTRAWELLIGAVLALRPPPELKISWLRELTAVVGLGLIGWAVFAYTEATPFPGLAALPPCIGTGLLIYAGAGRGALVSRVLALPPFVGVGLISYSLYLVHWPVISFFTYYALRPAGLADVLPLLGVSLVLAVLSWRFVERPFRSKGLHVRRITILSVAVGMIAALVAVGWWGVTAKGFPGRFPPVAQVPHDPKGLWHEGTCFLDHNPDISRWSKAGCTITHGGTEPVLLWGDSYAAHYVPGIEADAARIPFSVIQYTAAGCPPILSYYAYSRPNCQLFNRNAMEIIRREHIKTVVISARWVDVERRGLDGLASTLEPLSKMGVKVYVIGQSPMFTTDVQLIAHRQGARSGADSWRLSFNETLNNRLGALSGSGFVDPVVHLCKDGACPFRQAGRLLFADEGHFTALGSVNAVDSYFPLLSARGASR